MSAQAWAAFWIGAAFFSFGVGSIVRHLKECRDKIQKCHDALMLTYDYNRIVEVRRQGHESRTFEQREFICQQGRETVELLGKIEEMTRTPWTKS